MLKKAIKLNYNLLKTNIGISVFFAVFAVMAAFLMGYYTNHIFFSGMCGAVFIDLFSGVNLLFGSSIFGEGSEYLQSLPLSRRSEFRAKVLLCGLWTSLVLAFLIFIFIKAFSHPIFIDVWGFKAFQGVALTILDLQSMQFPYGLGIIISFIFLFLLCCAFCAGIGVLQLVVNDFGNKRRKGPTMGITTMAGGIVMIIFDLFYIMAVEGIASVISGPAAVAVGIVVLIIIIWLLGRIWIDSMNKKFNLA